MGIFFLETTKTITLKLFMEDHWMVLYQTFVEWSLSSPYRKNSNKSSQKQRRQTETIHEW